MKIKHIYWFSHYNLQCPSVRYRGKYPLEIICKEKNISYDLIHPDKIILNFIKFIFVYFKALLGFRSDSLIVIQKVCSNSFYANALKLLVLIRKNRTHYDLDDAEYVRQQTVSLHFFLKNCNTISVGSNLLKEYALKFNKNVFVLTSPVSKHNIIKSKRNKIPVIGWVGDFGNGNLISKDFSYKTSFYKIIFPELLKISYPIQLSIIGVKNLKDIEEIQNYFKDKINIQLHIPTQLDWIKDDWIYSEISKFDIGISPMTDHIFNQSKSAFKAKQYLSVGIPTVASDVGENKFFVKNEFNGFLCSNGNDFTKSITKIINMTDYEYHNMSKFAFQNCYDFSIENYNDNFIDNVQQFSVSIK